MKTRSLPIIIMICTMIVPPIQNVMSMPDLSPQDLYKQSDMVFYGQVISKQSGPSSDYYQIKVITYYKNPQTSNSITAAGHKPQAGHMTYPQFEAGDKAIFYITKIDGINTISPYSQKAGEACDVHSFLGPEYFGTPELYRGGYASNPRLLDINGNAIVGMVLKNQEVVLSYDDVWNTYPAERTIPVKISIQNEDNGHYLFNMTQNLQVPACSFAGDLKWNFVPTEIGNYVAKIDIDNKTKIGYGFSVMLNATSGLQTFSSPLQQFKSGIKPEYVKCASNLHLIIKAEDGSFACVTIETGKKLALRGWAITFNTGISTSDYYTKCDIPYPKSDTGVAVLYMPTNSIGKICIQYHNLNNAPTGVGMKIFEANDLAHNASNVTAWTYDSTLEANANKTIVYFIKTGTEAGFYGASLNCGGFPLAVGYDDNSTITASDFPWIGQVFHCGVITYDSHIEGTTGIGVKYIPYP